MRDGGPHLARPAFLAFYLNGHHVDTQPPQSSPDTDSFARAVVRGRCYRGWRVRVTGHAVWQAVASALRGRGQRKMCILTDVPDAA